MKNFSFTLGLIVLLLVVLSTVTLAAVLADQAYVSNSGSINGVYSTAGGYPHYDITASSSASVVSQTVGSFQVDGMWVYIALYRNNQLVTTAGSVGYYTKYVSKVIDDHQEYGSATWKSVTTSEAIYIDGSKDDGNVVTASKYFSVQ